MSVPVPSGPFARPIRVIGDHLGTSGTQFDFTRFDQGRIVKRIGVHYNPSTCLRGISISYENGDTRTTGALQNSYNEITLEPGETIRRASLWGNGRGTRTGRIWLETDRGRTLAETPPVRTSFLSTLARGSSRASSGAPTRIS